MKLRGAWRDTPVWGRVLFAGMVVLLGLSTRWQVPGELALLACVLMAKLLGRRY